MTKPKAYPYIRISTKYQSLKQQKVIVKSFDGIIDGKKFQVQKIVKHVGTGWNDHDVTILNELIKKLKSGDCILVELVDRFSRKYDIAEKFMEKIHKKGAFIYSIGENLRSDLNTSEFEFGIRAAEKESWNKSYRGKIRGMCVESEGTDSSDEYIDDESSVASDVGRFECFKDENPQSRTWLRTHITEHNIIEGKRSCRGRVQEMGRVWSCKKGLWGHA